MANPVDYAHNTQTCTVTTEHFLSSPNTAGTYVLTLDFNAAAAGDVFEIRVYKIVLTGGTQRVVYIDTIQGAQPADGLIWVSVPISTTLTDTNALRFSLKQTLGTGRAIPWVVEQYT